MAIDLAILLGAVRYGAPGWTASPIVLVGVDFPPLLGPASPERDRLWRDVEDTCGLRRGVAGNMEVSEPSQIWLFLLDDPSQLIDVVPRHWLDPQPTKLDGGILWPGGFSRNLHLGTTMRLGFEKAIECLLDMRVAQRVLVRLQEHAYNINSLDTTAFEAWRCRICGERGRAPRPDRCRRWMRLCSENTIVPLIDRVYDEVGDVAEAARAAGIAVTQAF